MSERTARKQIEEAVESAMIDGFHALEPETQTWNLNIQLNTDRIIAIVREALLSDEAVEKAVDSAGNEFVGVYADAEDMLTAALNAAFGTDDK